MAEKEKFYGTKVNYNGVFNFNDFYLFCYNWLKDEMGLDLTETRYSEKITGVTKKVVFEWQCSKKIDDYFKLEVRFFEDINGLAKVEVNQGGQKIQTNKGGMELKIEGTLVRDYQGTFEKSGFLKFIREIYEKYITASRIDKLKEKLNSDVDEFTTQVKAWLDLEGRK